MRIVVTSFGAFGGYADNPSETYAKALYNDRQKYFGDIGDVDLHVESMPVNYDFVEERVPHIWTTLKPDLVIHLGVHPVADTIKLERQSFADGYCTRDVLGNVPNNNAINVDTCTVGDLCTRIDVDDILKSVCAKVADMNHSSCSVQASDDPGRYLCAFSYYKSLSINPDRSLFIHVPMTSDNVSVECVTDILATVIKCIVKSINGKE